MKNKAVESRFLTLNPSMAPTCVKSTRGSLQNPFVSAVLRAVDEAEATLRFTAHDMSTGLFLAIPNVAYKPDLRVYNAMQCKVFLNIPSDKPLGVIGISYILDDPNTMGAQNVVFEQHLDPQLVNKQICFSPENFGEYRIRSPKDIEYFIRCKNFVVVERQEKGASPGYIPPKY